MTDGETRGNEICAHLKARGLRPVWMEAPEGHVVIGFEFISAHPSWTKAFACDAPAADPAAFVLLINDWTAKVRKDIAIGMASSVVRKMIAVHGMATVARTLQERSVHEPA